MEGVNTKSMWKGGTKKRGATFHTYLNSSLFLSFLSSFLFLYFKALEPKKCVCLEKKDVHSNQEMKKEILLLTRRDLVCYLKQSLEKERKKERKSEELFLEKVNFTLLVSSFLCKSQFSLPLFPFQILSYFSFSQSLSSTHPHPRISSVIPLSLSLSLSIERKRVRESSSSFCAPMTRIHSIFMGNLALFLLVLNEWNEEERTWESFLLLKQKYVSRSEREKKDAGIQYVLFLTVFVPLDSSLFFSLPNPLFSFPWYFLLFLVSLIRTRSRKEEESHTFFLKQNVEKEKERQRRERIEYNGRVVREPKELKENEEKEKNDN